MKKRLFALICALSLGLLAACGNSADTSFTRDDLSLHVAGTTYRLGMAIGTVTDHLGDGYEYAEGRSCDYDGLDKTYIYDLAEFYTFPLEEGDMLSEVYTESPDVTTSKGLKVGVSKRDVLSAYGDDCEDTGYQLIYSLPDKEGPNRGSLCFDLDGDVVKAIYITARSV